MKLLRIFLAGTIFSAGIIAGQSGLWAKYAGQPEELPYHIGAYIGIAGFWLTVEQLGDYVNNRLNHAPDDRDNQLKCQKEALE